MSMSFSSQVKPRALITSMSSRSATTVGIGSVERRQSADVVKEMAEIAKVDIARMVARAAPTPTPTPSPGRYSQRRPIKHRKAINPVPAPKLEVVRVAAIKAAAEEEAQFLEATDRLFRRPRAPTPPRRGDDYYDLAKWSRQRWH